jgi:bile acid-coenzyme A ligase
MSERFHGASPKGASMSLPEVVSYGQRLHDVAALRPDDVDLVMVASDGSERGVPWGELESRANQIGRLFEEYGVTASSRVALALPNCLDHIFVTLATWKLGATLLPLRHDMPQWEMDRLLALAKPAVVVSDVHTAGEIATLTRRDLEASASRSDAALPDRIPECLSMVASSGSTGLPKLIVTPVRGVVADNPQMLYSPDHPSTILVTSPLYHVNGFNFASPPLLEGAHSFVMERFDAALAVRLIERHKITFTVMVPTMLQRIAHLDGLRPEQFASLETLIYGGAKIPEWLVDRWIELVGAEVFNLTYGSSELLGLARMTGLEWADHRGATGRSVDATISIRDDEGNERPVGEIGHIYMRPTDPNRRLFQYVGGVTPPPTADGFHTIGDLGSLDADGYLYVADRRTDLIITGGANVFPAEVEAALSEHPGVIDQVVVGVPDPEWGQRVHAIVQPRDPSAPPDPDELRSFCKQRLASYKVPKTYEVVERVTRTEAGKLNRNRLAAARAESADLE